MKKALIAVIGATLLAVGCSNNKAASNKKSFTFDDAITFYESFDINDVTLPKYKANKEATMEFYDDYLESDGMIEARISNSPRKEMLDYVKDLKSNGWSLTKDDAGDYSGYYKKNPLAEIMVADWTLETYDEEDNVYDAIRIFFYHGAIPSPEWPEEGLQAIFAEYEEVYFEVPEFVGEDVLFTADVYLAYGIFPSGAMVVVSGATADEIDNYITTTLPGAGWTTTGDSAYGTATKAFPELGGMASIQFGMDGYDFLIVLDFGFSQIPTESFPAEAIAAGFEALGLPAFTLVEPDGEGYTYNYQFDEYNLDYLDSPTLCYDYVYIHNVSPEEFTAYQTKLENNGWHTESEESPYQYYKHFAEERFTAHIRVRYDASSTGADSDITITIYYITEEDPLENWPAEEVAALLGEDVTDVLPAVSFEDTSFKMTKDGVKVFIDEDSQEALVTAYKETLATAEFTFDEEKGYYTSPNEQFVVKLSTDTDGNMLIQLFIPGFISRNAQAWLDSRGLDGETVPDFSSLEQYYKDGGNQSSCYKVWLDGDHTEAIKALLVGYDIPTTPSEKWGYECKSASGLVEIDFRYDSEPNETVVWFYYYPDIAQ